MLLRLTLRPISPIFALSSKSLLQSCRSLSDSTRARAMSEGLTPTDPATVANPLGEGKYIKTAACLIIGDEVLNGKTKDTNSNFFAKWCFEHGVELKRIEVIADDEDEIVEAARRMTKNYDFVVTSGGIGPTHDDITYESLGKAFELPLEPHAETSKRMWQLASESRKAELAKASPEQKAARDRMALFPTAAGGHGPSRGQSAPSSEVIYVEADLWVPVVRLAGKLCIFPGIPSLFQRLITAFTGYLPLPPPDARPFRHLVHTTKPESMIAPFLTDLQKRAKADNIRIGSYPSMGQGVHVSLIGHDVPRIKELGEEVVKELEGTVVAQGAVGDEKGAAKM